MAVKGLTQRELGDRLGTSQPAISGWVQGEAEPAPTSVFETERVLGLAPGGLSRILGYLPIDAVKAVAGFEAVVMEDGLLDEPAKRGLLAMYRELTSRRPSKGGRPASRRR